jgi:rhodanese-related sulfurtransferase
MWRNGAVAAKRLGYTNIKHLAVGIRGWKKAGEPTESAKTEKG